VLIRESWKSYMAETAGQPPQQPRPPTRAAQRDRLAGGTQLLRPRLGVCLLGGVQSAIRLGQLGQPLDLGERAVQRSPVDPPHPFAR
jgi:hypothetical protein